MVVMDGFRRPRRRLGADVCRHPGSPFRSSARPPESLGGQAPSTGAGVAPPGPPPGDAAGELDRSIWCRPELVRSYRCRPAGGNGSPRRPQASASVGLTACISGSKVAGCVTMCRSWSGRPGGKAGWHHAALLRRIPRRALPPPHTPGGGSILALSGALMISIINHGEVL